MYINKACMLILGTKIVHGEYTAAPHRWRLRLQTVLLRTMYFMEL